MTIEEIKQRKRELGYSMKELSRRSGVPLGTLQKIFTGETRSPRMKTVLALEVALRGGQDGIRPAVTMSRVRATDGSAGFRGMESSMIPEESPDGDIMGEGEADRVAESSVLYGAAASKRPGDYTSMDYYALPPEQRAELIDGEIYDMAAPSLLHQLLATEIGSRMSQFVEEKEGECVVFAAPIDVCLDCDDRTILQPDLSVVCDRDRLRTGQSLSGAPDLVIEILSPSTRKRDMFLKCGKYMSAGVREYWMVDPENRKIIAYHDLGGDSIPTVYTWEDAVPVAIWNGECRVDFHKIERKFEFLLS